MIDQLSIVYLPVAVGLGALHALEPGHSKTLMAAYLIGTKGTKRDAVVLGLSAATTHSVVVIGLAVAALWLGREAFTERASYWLQVGSGVVVIGLGLWMLWQRWPRSTSTQAHHHETASVPIVAQVATGTVGIIGTPAGERMRFVTERAVLGLTVRVVIQRTASLKEELPMVPDENQPGAYISQVAPAEPHEFSAICILSDDQREERVAFAIHEPPDHDHDNLDEDAHARAHAAAMPEYVKNGQHPSLSQVMAFGAAGGLIPCPASITVMLLALSIGQVGLGVAAVLSFSLGLAGALVGVGLIVVAGISRLSANSRLASLARHAPVVSALLVLITGVMALSFAH